MIARLFNREPKEKRQRSMASARHWTWEQWVSLVFHVALVGIPFGIATYSTLYFWHELFGNWAMPPLLVAVVEIPALAMFVFHIAGIESRFLFLRHLLPVVSAVPLGWSLHLALLTNGNSTFVAWLATVVVAVVLMAVSALALLSVEDLFVTPVEAATRRARKQVSQLANTFAMLDEMNGVTATFVSDYKQSALRVAERAGLLTTTTAQITAPTETRIYSAVASQEGHTEAQEGTPLLRDDAPNIDAQNGAQRASKSAMIREYKARGLKVADIIEKHPDWDKNSVAPIWSRA